MLMLSKRYQLLAGLLAVLLPVLLVVNLTTVKTAALQLQNRTFYIDSTDPGATTFYEMSFTFPSPATVGSLKFEFCDSPLWELPCVAPSGLDVSSATLTDQQGETGFSVFSQDTNSVVLSRTAGLTTVSNAKYQLSNTVNPNQGNTSFYVRMSDYTATDASGTYTDFGSAVARLNDSIAIYTQVPPILIFCVAQVINDDQCNDVSGTNSDLGELSANTTRTTNSEMLARTNAQFGYAIVVSGSSMASGVNSIPALSSPTPSFTGVGQFGINLVANSNPAVGADPSGPGTNAVISSDYAVPNKFTYRNGDTIASVGGVSLDRKFTTSYMVNVPTGQSPGIYSTTLTYICTAGF
jgi:hypothetical protein